MATPPVTLVEPLGVDAVQSMHRPRKLLARALDDEVKVGSKETPSENANPEELH